MAKMSFRLGLTCPQTFLMTMASVSRAQHFSFTVYAGIHGRMIQVLPGGCSPRNLSGTHRGSRQVTGLSLVYEASLLKRSSIPISTDGGGIPSSDSCEKRGNGSCVVAISLWPLSAMKASDVAMAAYLLRSRSVWVLALADMPVGESRCVAGNWRNLKRED